MTATTVHLVSLGCARNDVDSEELAARLELGGFQLVGDPSDADAVMVNTCGFVESAKKDSIDTLLAAADLKVDGRTQAVVAVGCLAERYGNELAESLPEADAVFGFDDYADVAERLQTILDGGTHTTHVPRDRRRLLPLAPADRAASAGAVSTPGHAITDLPAGVAPASGPRVLRRRLTTSPWAPLKLASGCDRRCSFCAIPAFRGSYLSRPPAEVLTEARWLAENGVKEVLLVSENSSSYGKDLGDLRLLEKLLPELAAVDGLERIRVTYLQPAEMRPGLIEVIATTPGVVPYFDLSFQHASGPVLRRMRRFGDADSFLSLVEQVRQQVPEAGVRSNVIVGFPGETEDDVQVLADFLVEARMDAIGVFGYSDEEGTEAVRLDHHLAADLVDERRTRIADLADELVAERAEERVGSVLSVLVDEIDTDSGSPIAVGRAEHQGPEVDGVTQLDPDGLAVGDLVEVTVTGTEGVDLRGVVLAPNREPVAAR
ncbi:MAG TPA: 30S ribosomal protein S12 methylthiotransferase RimO [Microlunatus sp.]|nr:30S ribosomal protein S12 methylthiotransferase RimO [Microlunatus sp.]